MLGIVGKRERGSGTVGLEQVRLENGRMFEGVKVAVGSALQCYAQRVVLNLCEIGFVCIIEVAQGTFDEAAAPVSAAPEWRAVSKMSVHKYYHNTKLQKTWRNVGWV